MPLSGRLRHAFLVGQVAGSVILVVIAGLFARALLKAGAAHPGFDVRGVELASLDPVTFAAVAVLFASVGLAACYAPGRRATAVDPVSALRAE